MDREVHIQGKIQLCIATEEQIKHKAPRQVVLIIIAYKLQEVGAGPLVRELVESLVVMHALRQRELDRAVVELLHLRPTARRRLDYLHFDDLWMD